MRTSFLMTVAASLLMSAALCAGSIPQRQWNQQARIREGVRSGELTRAETARLQQNAYAIQRTVARDRRDGGGLSRYERAKIDRMQDAQSRAIARQKNDRQNRW